MRTTKESRFKYPIRFRNGDGKGMVELHTGDTKKRKPLSEGEVGVVRTLLQIRTKNRTGMVRLVGGTRRGSPDGQMMINKFISDEVSGEKEQKLGFEKMVGTAKVTLKNKDGELNLAAKDSISKEKETHISIERSKASLSEEFDKVQAELDGANRRPHIASINDMYKLLQDCNSSLRLYNSKLQTDLTAANETIKREEKERLNMVENLHTLRCQHKSLQDQLTSSIASQEGAMKEKDALMKEVACLRMELHQIKDDRDQYQQQEQSLAVEVSNYKELATNSSELEISDMSALMTKNEFEGKKDSLTSYINA
ncbi:Kinesin 3 isoform 2 [Hibiscus syriacus]|uniref:Kinesin 3 isoform 2 n=1 Tax=Hibiscus syriacus TaxID=106335 RepID=A0A6A3CRZ2_HIBSY|nr:Kinesin 3 isoform 2 [Hibiscus syriacus]